MRRIWKMQYKIRGCFLSPSSPPFKTKEIWYERPNSKLQVNKREQAGEKTCLTELVLSKKFMEQFVRFTLPKLHGCKFTDLFWWFQHWRSGDIVAYVMFFFLSLFLCSASSFSLCVYFFFFFFLTKMMTMFWHRSKSSRYTLFLLPSAQTQRTLYNRQFGYGILCTGVGIYGILLSSFSSVSVFSIRLRIFICLLHEHQYNLCLVCTH